MKTFERENLEIYLWIGTLVLIYIYVIRYFRSFRNDLEGIHNEIYDLSEKIDSLHQNSKWRHNFNRYKMKRHLRDLLYYHIMNHRLHHGQTLYRTSTQYLSNHYNLDSRCFKDAEEFFEWL